MKNICKIKILKLLSFLRLSDSNISRGTYLKNVSLRRVCYCGRKKVSISNSISDWNYVLITKASIILDVAVLVITFERIVSDTYFINVKQNYTSGVRVCVRLSDSEYGDSIGGWNEFQVRSERARRLERGINVTRKRKKKRRERKKKKDEFVDLFFILSGNC